LISKKELGQLWGVAALVCPIIMLTLANTVVHCVTWNPLLTFCSWAVLLSLGAALSYYVENSS